MTNSTLQMNSSNEYRGRVMSVFTLLLNGTTPFGNFYAGAVMQRMGGGMGFLMCGVATLVPMIVLMAVNFRAFQERPAAGSTSE